MLAVRRFETGNAAGALAICDQIAATMQDRPELWQVAGLAAFALADYGRASASFQKSVTLEPANAGHLVNLANALIKQGRDEDAAQALRQALQLMPDSADAWIGLGTLARRRGDFGEAIACADRALTLRPTAYQALVNKGRAHHEQGNFAEAFQSYERAIAVDTHAPAAHAVRALTLLLTGDFASGWAEYEWRGEGDDILRRQRFSQAEWRGEKLGQGTLLVHAEQGLGDTVQFARFLAPAAARCGHLVIEVQPAAKRLLETLALPVEIFARGEAIPHFDRHIRLMSLPHVLGVGAGVSALPYLRAPNLPTIPVNAEVLTVGLCWAGNAAHENDRNRSVDASLLAPLGTIPGVRFVSIQKGEGGFSNTRPPFPVVDIASQLTDLGDLATALGGIDLLISIDSAPVHVMGALGKPVWVLLPDPPDWRWQLGRQDSPWYGSARLFRQSGQEGWPGVVLRVAATLSQLREEMRNASIARASSD